MIYGQGGWHRLRNDFYEKNENVRKSGLTREKLRLVWEIMMEIYFTEDNKQEYMKCVEEIVQTNWWSEGKFTKEFEELCAQECGTQEGIAVSNCGAGLYILCKYLGVNGKEVIIPGNTFYATAIAAKMAGAKVVYADCNREDLCMSFDSMVSKVTERTVAVILVHIGGHIAFDVERIAAFCKAREIALIEDCAHAHGAEWNGKKAGSWGIGGVYSFYATKTLTTGEGGMVVTNNKKLADWCRVYRNYGKRISNGQVIFDNSIGGMNFRISEFTAALGCIQMRNLKDIVAVKQRIAGKYDEIFTDRILLPKGMKSGYYKYIVFDQTIKSETGKVFDIKSQACYVDNDWSTLKNCIWVGEHHSCVPIFSNIEYSRLDINDLKSLVLG